MAWWVSVFKLVVPAVLFLAGILYISPSPLNNSLTTPYYNLEIEAPKEFNRVKPPSISNFDYSSYLSYVSGLNFTIDDTQAFESFRDLMACLPESFGYSVEEGLKIFPPKKYPDCAEENQDLNGELIFDTEHNIVQLDCKSDYEGKYILGPRDGRKLVRSEDNEFKVHNYPGESVQLEGDEEYVLASCKKSGKFEYVSTRPRFNQTVFDRAQQVGKSLGYKFGKPVTILNVIIDSFSRRHFYRKLEDTVQYLNDMNHNGTHAVFDYKLHNINGVNSIGNMVVTLSGLLQDPREAYSDTPYNKDIWNKMKELGFVTFVGQENCNHDLAIVLGENISVDHSVNEFYCAAEQFSKYSIDKYASNVHRCIGKKMSHEYIMNYTLEFLDIYAGVDKWVYIHLNAAHEGSGQHAATLDQHLPAFLQKILSRDEIVILLLEADHGMRYGDWQRSESATVEWKLPALFAMMPHEVMKDMYEGYSNMLKNTYRLTSKFEVRNTMLDIAYMSKGIPYSNIDSIGSVLYKDVLSVQRTCKDAMIDTEMCSCLEYVQIDPDVYTKPNYQIQDENLRDLNRLMYILIDDAMDFIHEQLNINKNYHKLCRDLTFDKITSASGQSDLYFEYVKIEFGVVENSDARFEVLYIIKEFKTGSGGVWGNPWRNVHYRGYKRSFKNLYVNRIDSYAGTCEKLSDYLGVPAKFCLCKEPLPRIATEALDSMTENSLVN